VTPRNRKAPPCPKCGRPIEYYAAMGEWWCGSAGCQTRTSAPPGAEPTPGRKRAQPKTPAPSPAPPAPAADADGEPPALAPLLDDVRALIRRYVIVDDAQADALTLWAAHTHALAAAEATPYLAVNSAEKRSGKTRLLEVLSLFVARPWFTGRVTAAVLVRKLAKETPTLLLDESDAAFKAEKEYAATLQAILNSGYRRGGCASLCVKAGGDFDLRDFPIFGPKAIAGIGGLPDTIADRAIPIALKRRAPNEAIARFRQRDAQEEARSLCEGLASWTSANIEGLTEARPDIPPELDDRAAEVWEPLFAIADAAGSDWPGRARRAAMGLSVGDGREDDSLGVRLLADIQATFDERKADRLSSGQLADALVAIEEAPWGDLRGKPLEARTLARRLRPYGIKPHVIRIGDATPRGYERADFEDAWRRYVPIPPTSATSATSATTKPSEYERERPNVADVEDVAASPGVQEHAMEHDDRPPADTAWPPDDGRCKLVLDLWEGLDCRRIDWKPGETIFDLRLWLRRASDEDVAKVIGILEAMPAPKGEGK